MNWGPMQFDFSGFVIEKFIPIVFESSGFTIKKFEAGLSLCQGQWRQCRVLRLRNLKRDCHKG